jgi:hypothetical protein
VVADERNNNRDTQIESTSEMTDLLEIYTLNIGSYQFEPRIINPTSMGTGSDLTDPTGSRHVNRPFCMGKPENGPPNRCQILAPICRRGRGGPPRPRRTPQIATDPPHTPYRPVRPGERAGGGDEGSRGSTTTPGVLARGSFIIIIRDRLFPNSLVVQLSSLISRSFICGADSFRSRRRGAHAGVGAGRCRARGRRRVGTAD